MKPITALALLIAWSYAIPTSAADTKPATIDAKKFPTLQAAFDALPDSGGIVLIPPGTYELTQPLLLTKGEVRIEGSGASTHIKNLNTKGEPAIVLRPPDRATNTRSRIWRIQLGNFRVSGNTNSGDGLRAEGIQEIFLHGLSIDHHGGHGINLIDCYEDPRVSDNILTYNKLAGLNIVACHDIVVNANHFEENQDALRCVDSFNLCMNGNNVDDHLRHGVVIENTYGSVVSGNMIEECNGIAIILDRDCYGITLSANVIAHHLQGGIDLRDAWGCAVSANTFTIAHKASLRIGPDSGRITVSANNFCNTYIGGGKDKRPPIDLKKTPNPMAGDEGTGVFLEGTSDVIISGNSFSGLSTEAVWTKGECQRILVSGNVISDLRKAKTAINLGPAKSSIVKDNIIEERNVNLLK
ncbi:MAG: right-handed parallel beta-helix repeat-containing protein [Verrucomicrobiota bacterium]